MPVKVNVRQNTYFDSVSLMSLSTKANQIEGIEQAVVAMGTEMNKGVLRNVGLFTPEVEAKVIESQWFLQPLDKLVENFEVFVNPASAELIDRLIVRPAKSA